MPIPFPNPAPTHRRLRVALGHDWLCGYRGGEGVLERLIRVVRAHHEFAGLYVMFDDQRSVAPAIDATERTVSGVGRWPLASTKLRRWMMPFYPKATRQLSRALLRDHESRPIDVLITSSSAAIKGLRAPQGVPHLCYCHTPPRYVWSQTKEYEQGSVLRRLGLRVFRKSYQRWDQVSSSADYVTRLIANSQHTAEEITRCYERSAKVIHPPVRTDFFTPAVEKMGDAREDAWLYVGALEPYKRVDLAIAAAKKLNQRLIIVGDGSELHRLLNLARGTRTQFLGRVDDFTLREQYRKARLLIFPQIEDFGITAVEAQACGMPVVARRAGGALDSVLDGQTGAFFDAPVIDSLIPATIRCPRRADAACRLNAERFSEQAFDTAILAEIDSISH